jgi:hypothetical protein
MFIPTAEVIIRHRKGLVALGLTNPWPVARGGQLLGTGSQGAAYDLGDRVLKLTHDHDEAIVSAMIRGKSLRNVVKIFDVLALPDSAREDDQQPWYVVTREKLIPPKQRDIDIMKVMYELYEDESLDLWVTSQRSMVARWRTLLQGRLDFTNVSRAMGILRDVAVGSSELRNTGFDWTDFHDENIFLSESGTYKIVDVGWGEWRVDGVDVEVPEMEMTA